MEALIELIHACRGADTDKITERKKQIDNIKHLLTQPSVIDALDKCSELKQKEKKSSIFGWDSLFTATKNVLLREAEALLKAKNSQSAANIKKKQEVSALFKLVVKEANKSGQHLNGSDVVNHIISIMKNEFHRSLFGKNHTSILVKDVLSNRAYWTDVEADMWHELLHQYYKLLLKPPSDLNTPLLAHVIHAAVRVATKQCDIKPGKLFTFFQKYFANNVRQEQSVTVSEYLVSALNILCYAVASECRQQICELGEEIFVPLLRLWYKQPSEKLKVHLIEFYQLQMIAHHPGGAKNPEKGAFTADEELWKSNLKKLYEAVCSDLQTLKDRAKFKKRDPEQCLLKDNYLCLATDICYQLFTENTAIIEVTQTALLMTQPGGTVKKRRLESGWGVIHEVLSQNGATTAALPWIQLLTSLAEKYPTSIPLEEFQPILVSVQLAYADSKHTLVTKKLLHCLTALAKAQVAMDTAVSMVMQNDYESIWQNIWVTSLRMISLHHASDEAFHLLTTLLSLHLVTPDRDVWNLFLPTFSEPTDSAICFLATYLRLHDIPEQFRPASLLIDTSSLETDAYPLRSQLLKWLLPERSVDLDNIPVKVTISHIRPAVMAEVLTCLTLKDTRVIAEFSSALPENTCDMANVMEIEKTYLITAFEDKQEIVKDHQANIGTSELSAIPRIQAVLKEALTRETQYFLTVTDPDSVMLAAMIHHACLLADVLLTSVRYTLFSSEDALKCSVYSELKDLLKKFAVHLTVCVRKDMKIASVLVGVRELFSRCTGQELCQHSRCYQVAALIRSAMPAELVNCLLEMALNKAKKHKPSSSRSGDPHSVSRSLSGFDDVDMDFDQFDDDSTKHSDLFDDADAPFMEGEPSESQGSSHDDAISAASESLFSKSILSDSDHQLLLLVDALIPYCSDYNKHVSNINNNEAAICNDVSPQNISSKLVNLIDPDSEYWDVNKPVYLQLLYHMVEGLCTRSHTVTEDEMEIFQDAIRSVCMKYKKDQDVCSVVLRLVCHLISQLGEDDKIVSLDKRQARDVILYLLQVFWKQMLKGRYYYEVRLALADCIRLLIQIDPEGTWTVWNQANSGEGDKLQLTEAFTELLNDSSHLVRLHVAKNIKCLFVSSTSHGVQPLKKQHQEAMFERVSLQMRHHITDGGQDGQLDEATNRMSSSLRVLANIARVSLRCEKKAVFVMCLMTKDKSWEISLVQKVLDQVRMDLGYKSLQKYMRGHMPYVLHQWLRSGHCLEDVPYQLSCFNTRAHFYRAFKSTIIPLLLVTKDQEGLQSLEQPLKSDWVDLVRGAIPDILVHVLPLFAAEKLRKATGEKDMCAYNVDADACYEFLKEITTQEVIEQSISNNLENIVFKLLKTLSYAEVDSGQPDIVVQGPEPNPPSFDPVTVKAALEYLTQRHSADAKSLVSLLARTRDHIEKVLLLLVIHLSSTHRVAEKYHILCMYHLFVKLLCESLSELGANWMFILRQVIYTLLHLLEQVDLKRITPTSDHTAFVCLVLSLLQDVVHAATAKSAQDLSCFLPVIISTVVPFTEFHGEIKEKVESIIQHLIIDNYRELKDSIAVLSPLPEIPAFHTANKIRTQLKYEKGIFSLRQEIEYFLKAVEQHQGGSTLCKQHELLKFLKGKLSSEKHQLVKLSKETELEPSNNLLVRLVYSLIRISKSADVQEANAAANCLGEIGPIRLPAIALKGKTSKNECLEKAIEVYKDTKAVPYCWIFHRLCDYLVDSDIDTVLATSSVLKQILATKTGLAFCTDYQTRVSDHLFQYLHPFQAHRKKVAPQSVTSANDDQFCKMLDVEELWLPLHTNHEQWLHDLVAAIIDSTAVSDDILRLIGPVCLVKTEFCDLVLPYLVHNILTQGNDVFENILQKHINNFFQHHCEHYDDKGCSSRADISQNLVSVQTMLNIVLYLRQQPRPSKGKQVMTPWDNNFWMDLDYLPIAKAAHNCALDFASLLLSEIWCNVQREKVQSQSRDTQLLSDPDTADFKNHSGNRSSQEVLGYTEQDFTQSNQLEILASLPSAANISVQTLMLEAYKCVGDPDALYGCGAGLLADTTSRIMTYEHENSWYDALGCYDLQMTDAMMKNETATQHGLLQSLQNCGCCHVLDVYLRGLPHQSLEKNNSLQDLQYDAAWRNNVWNLSAPARLESDSSFNQAVYTGLLALRDWDTATMSKALSVARQRSLNGLSLSSLECVRRVYPTLSKLHSVKLMEDVLDYVNSDSSLDELLGRWSSQDHLLQNDFSFVEPVLSLRCVLLQTLGGCNQSVLNEALVTTLEKLSKLAREAGRTQLAERYVHQLRGIDVEHEELRSCTWRIEEAWVFWCRGETETAKYIMKQLLRKLEPQQTKDTEAALVYAKCLGIYGNWLAETKSENPNVIMGQYLQKAEALLTDLGAEDEAALDAFLSLARFANAQYQNIVNHKKSAIFKSKEELVKKAKQDAQQLRQIGEKNSHYLRILEKQRLIDEAELQSLNMDKDHFLKCALVTYLKCLQTGDRHDLCVFRMSSLWFDNSSDVEINKIMKSNLPKIKSSKFLPLMYQLAARMSVIPEHDPNHFQNILNMLIQRTVLDHPHHTLYIIMALAHANKDNEMMQDGQSSRRLSSRATAKPKQDSGEEDRVLAAKNMVKRLLHSNRANIVQQMEILCLAYIQMANWNVDQYKRETKPINIPSSLMITQLKDLTSVVVPTIETKVDPSCQYNDIVYVKRFLPKFKLAGGINLPKIINCMGSDGVTRRQLVKGKDDLRQDAVMQQVFQMVNNLLQKDESTHHRQLKVRTYKVIPLSQRSGLLEWCEGTVPMGEYLIASIKGAHERYRPQDLKARQCREAMAKASGGSRKQKYETFIKVCKKFKPVFRHFFLENFPEATDWYQHRLSYTHSVSTNSIVGYILGLGDRHIQNILIDTKTAEMIHIDLGVAFEQGRILPTPETVPFRLTRDVVDGMGVTGVEGVFRRCCEKTLEVMRGSHEALITILQVLLYDPLYAWTLSPEKAYHLQHKRDLKADDASSVASSNISEVQQLEEQRCGNGDSIDNLNQVAERVLLRLQQKLHGVEDGVPLSISGQVNLLIQEATDPKNLCCLFPGWQPYV